MSERSLQVSDHTKIVEFVLGNYKELHDMNKSTCMTSIQILEACADLARTSGRGDPQLFLRAAGDVQELDEFLAENEVPDSVWQDAPPVLTKVIFANSNEERIGLLERASGQQEYDDSLRTGFRVAKDILIDGADTIYSPETLPPVVYQLRDPREAIGQATALWHQVVGAAGVVKGIAAADAVGALGGAAAGAASAAAKPGATAGTIAAGAADGALKGAISASVGSSFD